MNKKIGFFLILTFLFIGIIGCSQTGNTNNQGQENQTNAPSANENNEKNGTSGIDKSQIMTWTSYDVGSAGYVQAAAVANAITKETGINIRIMPSGTSVGRLTPLKSGQAKYGLLSDEVFFASEGLYEFANYEWGPQDLRVLLQPPSPTVLAVTKESGIKTPADLKGKKIAWVQASPSLYVKTEALLAFANLTWDDVEKIEVPSHGDALNGLIEGRIDAAIATPTVSKIYELENSPQGLHWLEFPEDDVEGWKRVQEITPWVSYNEYTDGGAGIEEGGTRDFPATRYPQVVTYANQSADEVYELMKYIDETYDLYKDVDPVMHNWEMEKSGRPKASAPFHEGSIRYLKEIGIWTEEDDAWNEHQIERTKTLQDAWNKAVELATDEGISSKDFPEFWLKIREEALK